MEKNDSIIVEVDESTKRLMQEVENVISSPITISLDKARDEIEETSDAVKDLIRRFKSVEGLAEPLRTLEAFATKSGELIENISIIKKDFNEFSSFVKNGIADLTKQNEDIIQKVQDEFDSLREEINSKVSELNNKLDKNEEAQKGIKNSLKNYYSGLKERFDDYEQKYNFLSQKIESILYYVTPFWKRKKKDKENKDEVN